MCCSPSTACTCRSPARAQLYAREGVELDVSTWPIGSAPSAATLMPLVEAIRAHVFAAERIHADDTTVPVLATGKTRTGRLWTYVRDDRPFAGADPPAAAYFYSPTAAATHPEAASGVLRRAHAGRRLCRLQPALRGRPQARADRRGGVLGPCTAQVLRPGTAQQGTDRHRGGRPASMRCSPSSARSTASRRPGARASAPGAQPAAGRRAGGVAARAAAQALAQQSGSPRRSPTASTAGTA